LIVDVCLRNSRNYAGAIENLKTMTIQDVDALTLGDYVVKIAMKRSERPIIG
jgi:hypothetical protein